MRWLVLLLLSALCASAQDRIPVLLVTGENNHDWKFTSAAVEKMLEATKRFDVTVTEKPSETLAREDLAKYRLIFLDYNGPRWGEPAESRFLEAVRGGVGVTVMHAANNAFDGWKDYETLVGHCWKNGKTSHGRFHEFDVDVDDPNHPITAGLPPMKAHPDELYHNLIHMHDAEHRVLMSAFSSKETGGSGKREPMATVLRFGEGRIFHTPLGHVWPGDEGTRRSLDHQFWMLLSRGSEWAATGTVTLAPEAFGLKTRRTLARRPHDPWVFRCVLDDRTRTVVVGLDDVLWVAWDAATCGPFKAWGGGVRLQGTVWDTVHGPQPESKGKPWGSAAGVLSAQLLQNGTPYLLPAEYVGYRFEEDRVIFTYRVRPKDRDEIVVEERPEHGVAGEPVLVQRYTVSGLGAGEMIRAPRFLTDPGDVVVTLEGKGTVEPLGLRLENGTTTVTTTFPVNGDVDG